MKGKKAEILSLFLTFARELICGWLTRKFWSLWLNVELLTLCPVTGLRSWQ